MTNHRSRPPRHDVSLERKVAYYAGKILMIIGILTFVSTIVTGILNFGDFSSFGIGHVRSMGIRAVVGIALIFVGNIVSNIGARGIAGSGIILDPKRARRDVEPWARMGGGIVKDALDEADIEFGSRANASAPSAHGTDFDERLRKLHRLHEDGILTKEEYEHEKREILDRL